jgi:hypothetical protein
VKPKLAPLLAAVVCAVLLFPGCSSESALAGTAAVQQEGHDVRIQIRNVAFRFAQDVELEVRTLKGRLKRTKPDRPVTFDDSDSFTLEIDTGEVAITTASLTALLNSYVFAYAGAPVKNIQVTVKGSRLIQKGMIHKGVDLPFEIEGPISATADGNIRLHADKIRSEHVPVKGLLHLFGADLSKLVNDKAVRGLRIEGDDMILLPRALTPPPHMDGHVVRVNLQGDKVVQMFDSGRHPPELHPPLQTNAYIYHKGGVLRFGKLLMEDADMEIVGDKPGNFFNFFLREYKRQLVAGYSKNTPANGLVVHMVDYSRFERGTRNAAVTGQE